MFMKMNNHWYSTNGRVNKMFAIGVVPAFRGSVSNKYVNNMT